MLYLASTIPLSTLVSVEETLTSGGNEIVLALIAVLATAIGGLVFVIKNNGISKQNNAILQDNNSMGKAIAKDAAEANKAVNHIEDGELSIYRLVMSNQTTLAELADKMSHIAARHEAWENQWSSYPEKITSIHIALSSMQEAILKIQSELISHAQWEMTQKYVCKDCGENHMLTQHPSAPEGDPNSPF